MQYHHHAQNWGQDWRPKIVSVTSIANTVLEADTRAIPKPNFAPCSLFAGVVSHRAASENDENYYGFLKKVRTHRKKKATCTKKKRTHRKRKVTCTKKKRTHRKKKRTTGRKNEPAGRKSETTA